MDYKDKSKVWRASSGPVIQKEILLSEEKLGSEEKLSAKL